MAEHRGSCGLDRLHRGRISDGAAGRPRVVLALRKRDDWTRGSLGRRERDMHEHNADVQRRAGSK